MFGLFGSVVIEPMRQYAIEPVSTTIILACTVGAFFLARWRPTLAIAALFITDEIEWTHVQGAFSLALSVLVASAVGIAFLTQPRLVRTLARPAVRIIGTGFGAVALALLVSGIGAERRDLVLAELVKLLEYAITFLIAHAAYANRPDDRLAVRAIAVAAIVVSLSAFSQLVTGAPAGVLIGTHLVPRIAGLLAGPNQLAGYLGLLFPVLLVAVIDTRSRLAAIALGVLILALLGTLSRGGFFAALVATLVVVQARPLRRPSVAGAATAAIVLVALAALASGILARVVSAEDVAAPDGLGTRTQLWHAALALFRSSPFVGIGAGNFEIALPRVGYPELRTHANSWFFEVLADGGLVLLAATVFWMRGVFRVLGRCAARQPFVLGALAATAGFLAHGIFDDLAIYPTVAGTWWLIVGVGAGLCADGEVAGRSETPTPA